MTAFVKVALVHEAAKMPLAATAGSVGLDLHVVERVTLAPWRTMKVRTGIAMELPKGHYGDVRPRSSVSLKGILVHAGTIDSDYRGEVHVTVTNVSWDICQFIPGQRLAQMLVLQCPEVVLQEVGVDELTETGRGAGGYGSTGV